VQQRSVVGDIVTPRLALADGAVITGRIEAGEKGDRKPRLET